MLRHTTHTLPNIYVWKNTLSENEETSSEEEKEKEIETGREAA